MSLVMLVFSVSPILAPLIVPYLALHYGWRSAFLFLALLNIVGKGMVGEPYESDIEDMDAARTAEAILHNKGVIVGIKTAHFAKPGWVAIDRAIRGAETLKLPAPLERWRALCRRS